MSQYSVPSTRPSRGKENMPLPERSVIIRDDPSTQSESSDLNQSECYTDYGLKYQFIICTISLVVSGTPFIVNILYIYINFTI